MFSGIYLWLMIAGLVSSVITIIVFFVLLLKGKMSMKRVSTLATWIWPG